MAEGTKVDKKEVLSHLYRADTVVGLPTRPDLLRQALTSGQMNGILNSVGRKKLERIASVTHEKDPNPDYKALAEAEGRDLSILREAIMKVLGCKRPWIIGYASDFANGLLACTE